jgi:hypothetical protein
LAWRPFDRAKLLRLAVIALIPVVMLTPWVVRNALVFGAFVPLTSQACPPCVGVLNEQSAAPDNPRGFGRWLPVYGDLDAAYPDEVERREARTSRSFDWVLANPGLAAVTALLQAFLLWAPPLVVGPSTPIALLRLAILLGGVAGLALTWRTKDRDVRLWLLAVATVTLFAVVTIGDPRHRLTVEPFVCVLAAVAVLRFAGRRQVAATPVGTRNELEAQP